MLKLYNTLTQRKEVFTPIKGKEVSMYSCGPTVYDFAHLGNFRAYIASDILRRWLEHEGFKVKQVMNLTDVDDKTIKGSQEQGLSLKEFTRKYEQAFLQDLERLKIEKPVIMPRATEHIKEMIELVKILLKKGYAYKSEDGIYYDISKFKGYGKLSHLKIKSLEAGASGRIRKDEYEKKEARDFVLWKFWKPEDGDIGWETSLGRGRPGWHLECSAMSMKYLGEHFDIHTGGVDLIFPHHENEIAQSEAATGKKFVNFWIHNAWLLVEGKRMAKSLGNFYTLRDLLKKGYDPRAIRFELSSTHYRKQLDFSFKALERAKAAIERINNFVKKIKHINGKENKKADKILKKARKDFIDAMNNDLNIPKAISSFFSLIRNINLLADKRQVSGKQGERILNFVREFDSIFCVLKEEGKIPENIQALVQEREKARKAKNWKKADEIRQRIKAKGFWINDTPEGPVLTSLKEI